MRYSAVFFVAAVFSILALPRVATAQTVPRIGTAFGELSSSGGVVSASGISVIAREGSVPAGATYYLTIVPQPVEGLPSAPSGLQLSGRPFSVVLQNASGQLAIPTAPLEVRVPLTLPSSSPPGQSGRAGRSRVVLQSPQPGQSGPSFLPYLYALVERRWAAIPTDVEAREVVGSLSASGIVALFLRPIPPELPLTGSISSSAYRESESPADQSSWLLPLSDPGRGMRSIAVVAVLAAAATAAGVTCVLWATKRRTSGFR
ncbi:MAG: hypothetical protein HY332_09370 [Chloroflexi bacterium]|nr:hypothetical protein [Chloroflexota bacterium]